MTVTRMPIPKDYVSAFFVGALFALGFAPYHLFFVGFLVFPAMILMLDRVQTLRQSFFLGWWFGLGQFLVGLYWVGFSFNAQGDFPAYLGAIAVLLLSAVLALYPALSCAISKRFWSTSVARILTFAAVWALFEWLRSVLFTGFPWNLTAHIWVEVPALMQTVSIIGSYSLTVFSVLVFALPILAADHRKENGSRQLTWGILSAFLMAFVWGQYRYSSNDTAYHETVSLRVVQANIAQKDKWVRSNWDRNILRYIDLSNVGRNDALSPDHKRLIVWPETAIPYFLEDTESLPQILAERLGSNSTLVAGTPRVDNGATERRFYNSVAVLNHNGVIEGHYDKRHLVPFGEYLPMRGILSTIGLNKLVEGASDFSSGEQQDIFDLEGVPAFSALICYEIIFPRRISVRSGAEWVINVTNDAWFGKSAGPYQHLAITRVRAIEMGLPVVRAAGTGISAVIDPFGRVLEKVPLEEMGVIDSKLPQAISGGTFYDRFGDWIFFLSILVVLALSLRLNSTKARK